MTIDTKVYDIVGIGIGPFNLGLACLSDHFTDVNAVFLDSREEFRWHPGMMLPAATIQVPFMADLVTMADPTSKFSFLNWLKETGRLYPFFIREDFHALRSEFDQYYRWACAQLNSLRWNQHVESVRYSETEDLFEVTACSPSGDQRYKARHVVMGIGTEPFLPPALRSCEGPICHSAEYLHNKSSMTSADSIAVVGSGQSAAEIYLDLLESQPEAGYQLDWITRSPRFFPMEDTKLTLEMTSPEYTEYFHHLPEQLRDSLIREQRGLYKGISSDLISRIYDALYRQSVHAPIPTSLMTDTSVTSAAWDPHTRSFDLSLHHHQIDEDSARSVNWIVAATGYAPRNPTFLEPLGELINRDSQGRLAVARNYHVDALGGRVFVQNAEEHTHGLTSPDLGMGAWRNATILAHITGEERYSIERSIAFQRFPMTRKDHSSEASH